MGIILDFNSFPLYEKWLRSPVGRALDGFAKEFIIESLNPQKNERVLDIGCGMGNSLLILNNLGVDATGIDASPYMIDLAKKRLGNKSELITGYAEDLPFSDNEFDFAFLINTLEYFDDPVAALVEAGRVARKKVLICTINSLSQYYLSARMQGFFHDTLIQHIRPYSLLRLKSFIRNAYGKVPVVWKCRKELELHHQLNPPQYHTLETSCRWPFGPILGMCVSLKPLVRTANLPLKIAVKNVDQPFVGEMPAQCNHAIAKGGSSYERSIPL
jgi:ubiquinone/menaquinone biosynthesis C-methylase UbiE